MSRIKQTQPRRQRDGYACSKEVAIFVCEGKKECPPELLPGKQTRPCIANLSKQKISQPDSPALGSLSFPPPKDSHQCLPVSAGCLSQEKNICISPDHHFTSNRVCQGQPDTSRRYIGHEYAARGGGKRQRFITSNLLKRN